MKKDNVRTALVEYLIMGSADDNYALQTKRIDKVPAPQIGMAIEFYGLNTVHITSAIYANDFMVEALLCPWNLYRPDNTELYVGLGSSMVGVLQEDLILRPINPNRMYSGTFGWGYDGWGPNTLGKTLLAKALPSNAEVDQINQDIANAFEKAFISCLEQDKPFVIPGRDIRLWAEKNLVWG